MGITNYQYTYADGSTGNSPWQKDANGNYMLDDRGALIEGTFDGRTMPDGSLNRATVGNADANGNVFLYDNYSTPASTYYGGGNANVFGGSNPGQQTPNGYGYDGAQGGAVFGGTAPTGGDTYNTKPLAVGGSGAAASGGAVFGGTSPGGGSNPYTGQIGGPSYSGAGGSSTLNGQMSTTGQNPYLQQMGQVLTDQMTNNFNRNLMPGLSSQFAASGGYGGSRQGVLEANALNDFNQQLGGALTNLYGQGYNTSLNYDLGLRNNALGFGNLGLGYAGLDRQINNDNFANQITGANLGLNVWDRLMGNNQTGISAGNTINQTPVNYWNTFTNGINGVGNGYSTTTNGTNYNSNPLLGALGGAQLGSQIGNWWKGGASGTGLSGGSSNPYGYTPGSFDYGLGSGSSGLGLKF